VDDGGVIERFVKRLKFQCGHDKTCE